MEELGKAIFSAIIYMVDHFKLQGHILRNIILYSPQSATVLIYGEKVREDLLINLVFTVFGDV